MTLVTDALSRAARQVSVTAPSSWLTATADEHVEIRDDFLLETIDDIQERIDLPSPIGAVYSITGDGSETYALPSQFKRLMRSNLAVYDSFLDQAVIPVTTEGDWTYLSDAGISGAARYYRLTGYPGSWSISFQDAPTSSVQVKVSYVSTYWITNASASKSEFTDPGDTLLLPRRLVEAGVVWRWRERKGLDFTNKYQEYEAMISRLSNDARGRKVVNFGNRPAIRWQDQIPSIIPTA